MAGGERFVQIHGLNNTDLNMYQCGTQDCDPGHFYGPAVRDHFLIHYILKGRGCFSTGGRDYHLSEGQGFLICPGIVTYYQADLEDPWSYTWVGFHGVKAEEYLKKAGLTSENPIFKNSWDNYIKGCFEEMVLAKDLRFGREIRLLGILHLFLSQLMEENGDAAASDIAANRQDLYIKKAIDYIGINYHRKVTIEEIAGYVGLDRSYLGALFKERLDTSLRDFLINYRIDKACELMKNESLSIGDISRSVGYEDQLLFSRIFSRKRLKSPRQFRSDYKKGIA